MERGKQFPFITLVGIVKCGGKQMNGNGRMEEEMFMGTYSDPMDNITSKNRMKGELQIHSSGD